MDEAPEFAANVLDGLRQPLENGHVVVARANQTAVFPARLQMGCAANIAFPIRQRPLKAYAVSEPLGA